MQLNQFIGKDNVVFQSVVFPSSQIETQQTWTKLHHLSSSEYLTYEGGKLSKSQGIGVFGDSAAKTGVPPDIWRYYLLSHRLEIGDSEFNWDSFINSNNNILLNNLGNFVSRVVKFLNSKHYHNIVPKYADYQDTAIDTFKDEINSLLA